MFKGNPDSGGATPGARRAGQWPYAAAVILGASLLFLVQPLIARIILPWFGGASSVWSAALLFFQSCVLAGYAYAHWLTKALAPRRQFIVHAGLLVLSCALLPILPAESWRPTSADDPTLRILALLTASVGLQALVLCSTSPLLHVWYMRRTGSDAPWFLFALSNAGSMLALLAFPFLLEPQFDVRTLALGWSAAYVVYAVITFAAAWASRSGPDATTTAFAPAGDHAPGIARMTLWVALAACASALLMSVSVHLSTNVAPIPLLWVAPLALYLLTFVLTFGSDRFYRRTSFFPWLAAAIGGMAYLHANAYANLHIQYVIPLYLAGLFLCCLACHGELVHLRPAPRYLTRFYLLIALGGALGGFFVAIIAPAAFDTYLETPLLLIAVGALGAALQWRRRGSRRTLLPVRLALIAGVGALVASTALTEIAARREHLLLTRNFYGVLRVRDELTDSTLASRNLVHGTISHGSQFLQEAYRNTPGSYFSLRSGVGRTLQRLHDDGPVRYGVIGLGAGVLASYARQGDYVRLYEINPEVLDAASRYFTFLSDAKQRGADVEVLLGDGRLVLERQPRQQLDLLVVDAFSSDAIPTHLLTEEAVRLYFEHLRSDGVLAMQISNRYLDLTPVIARAAERVGRQAVIVRNPSDGVSNASVWALITSRNDLYAHEAFRDARMSPATAAPAFAGWTDQYSSLWPVLSLRAGSGNPPPE
jgi:hypothetical protein